jgi:endoglucanase
VQRCGPDGACGRVGCVDCSAMHDYADAVRKSLLFFRAQRSGNLSDTGNPIPWRLAPSFLSDGSDVGVDLSRGYFDAGDYVKYGQPAAYTISVLAWTGVEFARGLDLAGSLGELKNAVRWGADFILSSATHIHQDCTYFAQVGRGAALHCHDDSCKYDHGYWGRPEDYASYAFAHQRRTYKIDSTHPGNEIWAAAAAALAAAHVLLVDDDFAYSAQLLGVSHALL